MLTEEFMVILAGGSLFQGLIWLGFSSYAIHVKQCNFKGFLFWAGALGIQLLNISGLVLLAAEGKENMKLRVLGVLLAGLAQGLLCAGWMTSRYLQSRFAVPAIDQA